MLFRIPLITLLSVVMKSICLLVRLKDAIQEDDSLHFENRDRPVGNYEEGPLEGDVASSV